MHKMKVYLLGHSDSTIKTNNNIDNSNNNNNNNCNINNKKRSDS